MPATILFIRQILFETAKNVFISISRIERLNYSSQLLSTAPPLKLIAESEDRGSRGGSRLKYICSRQFRQVKISPSPSTSLHSILYSFVHICFFPFSSVKISESAGTSLLLQPSCRLLPNNYYQSRLISENVIVFMIYDMKHDIMRVSY